METGLTDLHIICSVLTTELWGIYIGLHLGWQSDFKKLVVEGTHKISFLSNDSTHIRGNQLVIKIRQLMLFPWEIVLKHMLRGGNECVD